MRTGEFDFFSLVRHRKTINLMIWRKCNYCYSCINSKGGQHHYHNTITNGQRCTVWELAFSTSQINSSVMVWDETEELWVYSEDTEIEKEPISKKRGIKSACHKKKWHPFGYNTLSHKLADKTFSSELFCLTISDRRCQLRRARAENWCTVLHWK